EAALRDLLIDPGLLQRVELAVAREAFECGDFGFHRRRRHHARTNRRTVDDHCACAALPQTAPELGALQPEVVAQHIEQRRGRFNVYRVGTAVHLKIDPAHRCILPSASLNAWVRKLSYYLRGRRYATVW